MQFATILGLDQIAVREFAARPGEQGAILGTIVVMRIAGGLLGYVSLLALLFLTNPYGSETTWIVAILGLGLIVQAVDSIDWWFLSRTRSRVSISAKWLAFLGSTTWRIVAVITGASVTVIAAATLFELVLAAIFLTFALRRHGELGQALQFELARAQRLMIQAWPMLLSSIAILVYMKSDQLLVGYFLGAEGAGVYAAAARLSEVWYIVPTVITGSVAPALVRARTADMALYEARFRRLLVGLTAIALAVAIPVALFAEPIVITLYGPRFADGADVLRLHIFTSLLVFTGVAQGQWIINEGLTRWAVVRTFAGAITAVGLNLLLLPRLGLIGAPLALLGGQLAIVVAVPALVPALRPMLHLHWRALRHPRRAADVM
jgi:PST family polysaccharide transporter